MAVRRKKSKKRNRIRSSTKNLFFCIYTIIIIMSLMDLYNNCENKHSYEKENVVCEYSNEFTQNYKIFLKKNRYMQDEYLEMDQMYVTDMIKNITIYYNYKFDISGEKPDKINATYNVSGKIRSKYSTDGKENDIWLIEKELLKEKEKSTELSCMDIDEKLELSLDEYNKLLNNFSDEYGIAISSILELTFNINITAYIKGEMITNHYDNKLEITMGEKTTKITAEKYDSKKDKLTEKEVVEIKGNKNRIFLDGIVCISVMYLWLKNLRKKTINYISNEFKHELNEILNLYADSVVKVDSKIELKDFKIIEIKDIDELIKLSEELFKPVLFYQIPNEKEAWFYITNEKECYIYILR